MPHIYDFSGLKNVKTIEVNPQGWVNPLTVEYGTDNDTKLHSILSYFWRIKGTTHTFVIPVVRMDFLSSGDYKKHFEDALTMFREDYMSWNDEGFNTAWSKEYEKQFKNFIIV